MKTAFLSLVLGSLLAAVAVAAEAPAKPAEFTPKFEITAGPFTPEPESLQQYKYPAWFRDAKLGIWAHWGPQAVPMSGDWYARHMYVQGHPQYKHHLETYGHPTKHGYTELIDLWKAEKWDPARLMGLYKKAGARYFVSMACHHDNFDLWNSKHHPWNAVNKGPKRDVVGDWQKAAKSQGLRFGVSEHMGASFNWFQTSHGSDKTGDLAGVPYDGANQKLWDLYHWPAAAGDTGWYSKDPRWHQEWFNRVKDVVDQYQVDLLYTDGGVPFGAPQDLPGRSLIAHMYNADAARHGGKPEVVYTCKQDAGGKGMWVQDLERGVMAGIRPDPWQTDTSIGDWYYNKNWKYRGADWVIQMLVDIVAKNGNLLINVVQRPDGSLDPEAEQVLDGMAAWIAINGEAIFETRPWLVHGEGPVKAKGGHFGEDFKYSAKDIRFTAKGDTTLFALALGWPTDGKLVIRSLAKFPESTGVVRDVCLLGCADKLKWSHTADGLTVEMPAQKPCDYAVALKIAGDDIRGFKPELAIPPVAPIQADAAGNFKLLPDDAELHGDLHTEQKGGQPNIGFWDKASDWASWKVNFPQPGKYAVTVSCGTVHSAVPFIVEVAGQKLDGQAPQTGSWEKFADASVGTVEIKQAGVQTLAVKPRSAPTWKAINLRAVTLTR